MQKIVYKGCTLLQHKMQILDSWDIFAVINCHLNKIWFISNIRKMQFVKNFATLRVYMYAHVFAHCLLILLDLYLQQNKKIYLSGLLFSFLIFIALLNACTTLTLELKIINYHTTSINLSFHLAISSMIANIYFNSSIIFCDLNYNNYENDLGLKANFYCFRFGS